MLSLPIFSLLLVSLPATLAATLTYNWSVDFVNAAPDNFTRQVIGINGYVRLPVHSHAETDIDYHRQWPCPTIEATVGDTVVVHLTNNLGTESTGLHFHGLNQFGTQVMDGPSGASQ